MEYGGEILLSYCVNHLRNFLIYKNSVYNIVLATSKSLWSQTIQMFPGLRCSIKSYDQARIRKGKTACEKLHLLGKTGGLTSVNPLDLWFQLGTLAESCKKPFTPLKADFYFIPGIASSGPSRLDLILECLTVCCGPRASRASPGHRWGDSVSLQNSRVQLPQGRKWKKSEELSASGITSFPQARIIASAGLLVSTGLCNVAGASRLHKDDGSKR